MRECSHRHYLVALATILIGYKCALKSEEIPENCMVYIYLPGLLVGLVKPYRLSMYNPEKKGSKVFCDLHTIFFIFLFLNYD